MAGHVDEELPEFLLGTLTGEARDEVVRHLAACDACARLGERLRASTEALAGSVTPVAPPPRSRTRLMSFVRGEGRFADLLPDVARLFDIDLAEAREYVARLQDPSAWMDGPAPGVSLLPLQGGPRLEGAMAAFVRLAPGTTFQMHAHHGEETNYVLQGGFREDSGLEVWPGDFLDKASGSVHAYTALEGPDCIAATVLKGVIELKQEEG